MTLTLSDVVNAQEGQRQRLDQVRENGGRFATAYGEFTSTGWGEKTVADCFDFGCVFIERPALGFAWSLADDQAGDPDDSPELVDTRFPRVSVGVYKWRYDQDNNFTGAWLAITVDTGSALQEISVDDPGYILVVSVTFQGVALKAVPHYLLESV